MCRFVQGEDRRQDFLLPALLDVSVSEDNPVRVIEAFINEFDFHALRLLDSCPPRPGARPAIRIPTKPATYSRHEAGRRTDLKPASILI